MTCTTWEAMRINASSLNAALFVLPKSQSFGITSVVTEGEKEKRMLLRNLLFVLMLVLTGSAWAGSGGVVAKNVWVNETVPGQTKVSVQMDLTSTASAGKLLAVDSPVAESGAIQKLWPSHGKVTMSPVRNVRLPRGKPVSFSERTTSLVLLDLKQPLKVGQQVPINLTVVLADGKKVTVEVQAEVRALDLSVKAYKDAGSPDVK